ncbi:hypothetical protein GGX14DRAFT_573809 [Mycena pura]|uniref:Uncharacterized protein n=1 Tax=Mycena pura TaxID=153505 RepID=A0AAD6UZ39_9AGAR|nr:hypothetical protein GGX14DRAFT_573809 [Mycena pura]
MYEVHPKSGPGLPDIVVRLQSLLDQLFNYPVLDNTKCANFSEKLSGSATTGVPHCQEHPTSAAIAAPSQEPPAESAVAGAPSEKTPSSVAIGALSQEHPVAAVVAHISTPPPDVSTPPPDVSTPPPDDIFSLLRLFLDELNKPYDPETMDTSMTRSAIRQLQNAVECVRELQREFEAISELLGEFDRQKHRSTKIQPLRPKWDELEVMFEAHLNNSKKIATEECAQMRHFRKVILPSLIDPPRSSEYALGKLENFIEDLNKFKNASEGVERDFSKLRKEMRRFKETFSTAVSDSVGYTNVRIPEVKDRIKRVKEEIERNNSWTNTSLIFTALGLVCVNVGVESYCAGKLALLSIATPLGTLAAAAAVLIAVGGVGINWRNRRASQSELKSLEEELEKLLAQRKVGTGTLP